MNPAPDKQPYFSERKPAKCPACGSKRVVGIVFGMPGVELFEAEQRGEVVLGGCCVSTFDPDWQCLDCETSIYPERLRDSFEQDPGSF